MRDSCVRTEAASERGVGRFYFKLFGVLAALKALSLTLHYFGSSPWGGPLVNSPDRFLPDALLVEIGLLVFLVLPFALLERGLNAFELRERMSSLSALVVRATTLITSASYLIVGQFDLEVVRWLGQHITLSYLRNFGRASDFQLMGRILSGDIFWSSIAVLQMLLTLAAVIFFWRRWGRDKSYISWKGVGSWVLIGLLFVSAHTFFRPSEKRWARIKPALWGLTSDAWIELRGLERPQNLHQAWLDYAQLLDGQSLSGEPAAAPSEEPPTYPLWRDDNIGDLPIEQAMELPLSERPDVILIVFETWRGWESGLVPGLDAVGSPQLNAMLREEALLFPYMHSNGFPSVEGCMSMHLSVLPHVRKIIFADFLHINSLAFPEILREAGYRTWALVGADPSFSNFTPWLERWYGSLEYDRDIHHDGPLLDRFWERYSADIASDDPLLAMVWTATTHPPYNVPEEAGVTIADTNEERYAQAIRYSDEQIARFIAQLRESPRWDRTVVVILGDHAQPTPEQWLETEHLGEISPGHTWTHMALFGGWHGLPEPDVFNYDVSHIDLAPTILGLLNLRTHNHFMGVDLSRPENRAAVAAAERPILAFRYGDIAWQRGGERVVLNVASQHGVILPVDRADAGRYGLVGEHGVEAAQLRGSDWPAERVRDLVRLHTQLLEENRLMPPSGH